MSVQLDTGTVFHGSLPLQLDPLPGEPAELTLLQANEANELLLKSITVFEEKPEHDETDPLSQELRRQDMKLNLILDMLGSLLRQHALVPPVRDVELTVEGIRCRGEEMAGDARFCLVTLHVDLHVPKALLLYAQAQPGSAPGHIDLRFFGLSQQVQNQLEKYIFRQHRRRVAQTRKGTQE